MELNEQTLKELGARHAIAGKPITPYDCRVIDELIHAEIHRLTADLSGMSKAMAGAQQYNLLRGAFNKGWEEQYAAQVA